MWNGNIATRKGNNSKGIIFQNDCSVTKCLKKIKWKSVKRENMVDFLPFFF